VPSRNNGESHDRRYFGGSFATGCGDALSRHRALCTVDSINLSAITAFGNWSPDVQRASCLECPISVLNPADYRFFVTRPEVNIHGRSLVRAVPRKRAATLEHQGEPAMRGPRYRPLPVHFDTPCAKHRARQSKSRSAAFLEDKIPMVLTVPEDAS